MKKNILSIIVIALLAVNIVLNVVVLFAVVPNASKTNELINRVASAVDLEIESDTDGEITYKIEDLTSITFENGDLQIPLRKDEGSTKDHFAVISGISLTLNTKSEDYDTVNAFITANEIRLKNEISNVFSKYTKDYVQNNTQSVKDEILEVFSSKKVLNSDTVVELSFGNLVFQ